MSGSTAARYQQHQQQLMQKLHASSPSHYSNTPSNVGQAGPHGPPPHHHPSFAYPGPPASPAGYPGYGGGPGHTPHGGPPGPPGSHLGGAGGPSPGIHGHPSASGMTPGGGHAGHGAGPQSQASGQSSHHAIHHGGHLGSQSQQNHQLNGHTGGHHVSHSSVQHPSQHHQSHQHHQQHQHVNGGSNNGGLNNSNDRNQNSSLNLNNSTSPHWQQQIAFANASRQSTSAHHHARAAHLQQRGVTTAGSVTVGDPSRHPVMSIGRPSKEAKEEKANGTLHKKGESHGAGECASLRTCCWSMTRPRWVVRLMRSPDVCACVHFFLLRTPSSPLRMQKAPPSTRRRPLKRNGKRQVKLGRRSTWAGCTCGTCQPSSSATPS